MGAADVAVRAQVHELGFQGALLVGGHRRPAGCRRDGLGGVGCPCVSFVEYRACPGPGLAQDLLAVTAGVGGHLFAVLLGAGHVLVGRLLGLGQDAQGLIVEVRLLRPRRYLLPVWRAGSREADRSTERPRA